MASNHTTTKLLPGASTAQLKSAKQTA